MPYRYIPLASDTIYHIINRGFDQKNIFKNDSDYEKFIDTFAYYKFKDVGLRFSVYQDRSDIDKKQITDNLMVASKLNVKILAYCLMPNHFHFLLKQITENGIQNFISKICVSYSKYFNLKYNSRGPLFEGRFKNKVIDSENILLHVSRYIHLNPYSASLVKDFDALIQYPFSSLREYLNLVNIHICSSEIMMSYFPSSRDYKRFVKDQADYQRKL